MIRVYIIIVTIYHYFMECIPIKFSVKSSNCFSCTIFYFHFKPGVRSKRFTRKIECVRSRNFCMKNNCFRIIFI